MINIGAMLNSQTLIVNASCAPGTILETGALQTLSNFTIENRLLVVLV